MIHKIYNLARKLDFKIFYIHKIHKYNTLYFTYKIYINVIILAKVLLKNNVMIQI